MKKKRERQSADFQTPAVTKSQKEEQHSLEALLILPPIRLQFLRDL